MKGNIFIPRRAPRLQKSETHATLDPENIIVRVPFEYDGDGILETFANNDSVDVRLEYRTLVLTARKSGTAKVTLRSSVGLRSKAASTELDVTLADIPSPVLADNSWDIIQRTIHAGYGKQFWTPGDKVPRRLDGSVGITDVTGDYYDVLLDIDHNPEYEGAHNAQFGLAWYADDKTTPIAFCDDRYGHSYSDARDDFRMNPVDEITTGWSEMQLRRVIQGFYYAIQDGELKKRIVAGPKYCDDGAYIDFCVSDPKDVRIFRDVIWIPRAAEMYMQSYSLVLPATEKPFNMKFPIFDDYKAQAAYHYRDHTTTAAYWIATRKTIDMGIFAFVGNGGRVNFASAANVTYGVRPCYTIS